MEIRETGYYWVKFRNGWIIAHWHDVSKESNNKTRDNWQMCGYDDWWSDGDFEAIGKEMHFVIEENEALKNQVKMYKKLLEVSTDQKMELVDENKLLQNKKEIKRVLWFCVGVFLTFLCFIVPKLFNL